MSIFITLPWRWVNPPTTAFMMEHRWRTRSDKGAALHQRWTPIQHISPQLQKALLAAEDQKFFSHCGFDLDAIGDAMEDRIEGKSRRGASTITQQVAKNLFLWPSRNLLRKGLEAYFTVLLEFLWPKERILEVHLNVAEFGNGIYGVEEACRRNFGKSAAGVSEEEAAMLMVVLPNPKARRVMFPSPQARERIDWILEQMKTVRLP